MRKLLLLLTIFTLVFVLAACGGDKDSKKITVGAKNFTEQFILAKMTTIMLEENGFDVSEKSNLASLALRSALENKQVDLTWDYTGTGLVTYLKEDPISDGQEALKKLNELDEKNGITWSNITEADNTYALIMREDHAKELGISTLSDLASYVNENPNKLLMASHAEFANRPDGIPGVEKEYGFEFTSKSIVEMDSGLTYTALKDEQVEVAVAFATDARIKEFDFIVLEDDKNFFPSYQAAVAMTIDAKEKFPEIEEILAPLQEVLNSQSLMELNYQVDIEEQSEDKVARDFLIENGLIEK